MGAILRRVRTRPALVVGVPAVGLVALLAVGACTSSPAADPSSSSTATPSASSAPTPTGSTATASAPSTVSPSAAKSSVGTPTAGKGNIGQVLPSRSVRNGPVVALTGTASVAPKVSVRLTGVRRITTKAQGPGEVAGPGISVRVTVANDSSRTVSLQQFAIAVETLADRSPAAPLTARYTKTIATSVEAGSSATGEYAFSAGNTRGGVLVTITYSATAPTARFVGAVR